MSQSKKSNQRWWGRTKMAPYIPYKITTKRSICFLRATCTFCSFLLCINAASNIIERSKILYNNIFEDLHGGASLSGGLTMINEKSTMTTKRVLNTLPGNTIFYNIFVPSNNSDGTNMSHNIIKEQLAQVAESFVAADGTITNNMVYYVTIGQPFDEAFMDEICASYQLRCEHVSHHDAGYEMITEQTILDYCNLEENNMQIVTYMHNKGIFNAYDHQNTLRRVRLTKAALSHDCMNQLSKNKCNVCGANFKSVWGPTFWGNMWSARCDYVTKLISPFEIFSTNAEAFTTRPTAMTASFFKSKKSAMKFSLGSGGHAAEQFISNHPSLIPCSFTKPEDDPNAIWSVDPPGDFYVDYVIHGENPVKLWQIMAHDRHLKEWYLLPGILWRYYKMYGEIPTAESWIWRHYPDGETWRTMIDILGFPQALYNRIESTSILKQKSKSEIINFR